MRFGHCKNCWWWEKIPSTIDVDDEHSTGMCWMQGTSDSPCYSKPDSYCPDYTNRLKTNKKFGQTEWSRMMIICEGIRKNYELQEKIQANGKNSFGFRTEFLLGAVSFHK